MIAKCWIAVAATSISCCMKKQVLQQAYTMFVNLFFYTKSVYLTE